MPSLGDLLVKVGIDASQMTKGLKDTSDSLKAFDKEIRSTEKAFAGFDKMGQRLSSVGASMTAGLTLPLAGAAVAATKFATDLNASMANIATLIPNSTARVLELKKSVQDLAIQTGKSTGDIAGGLYQVISAFGDSADTVKILDINARAAAAGLATTLDAINLTSAVTKGYGDTSAEAVQKASDLAFVTVKLGQTTFPELASSIGRVVPLAAALGVTQEELFAVMATGTGVTGSAAEVSTQLRGALQSLLSPTKDMSGLLASLGVESGKALLEQQGLKGSFDTIAAAAAATGQPLQKYVSQIEAQTLLLALAGPQAETFATKLDAMGRVVGATDEAFREQTKGINAAGFTMQQVAVRAQVVAEKFGDALAPALNQSLTALNPLLQTVESAVAGFGTLPQPVQNTAIALAGVTAAAGPVIFVSGQMVSSFVSLGSGLSAASSYIDKAGGSMKLLQGAMSATIPVALAAGTAFVAFNELKRLSSELSETARHLGDLADHFRKALPPASDFQGVLDRGKPIIDAHRFAVEKLGGALGTLQTALETANKVDWWETFKRGAMGPLGTILDMIGALNKRLVELKGLLGIFPEMDAAVQKVAKSQQDFVGTTTRLSDAALQAYASARGLTGGLNAADVALRGSIPTTKEAAKAAKELAKEHKFATEHARKFLDTQPLLAAKIRIVESEYKKNIESLAALKLALERGTLGLGATAEGTEKLAASLKIAGAAIKNLPQMPGYTGTIKELDELGKSYERLGVKTAGELRKIADQHQADFNRIKGSGIATAHELELAWWKLMESLSDAARQAGETVPIEIEAMLSVGTKHTKEATEKQKTIWEGFSKSVSTVITNFAQDISKSLWDGDMSWGEKGKNLLKSLGQAVTSSFIEPATAAIGKFITGVLADLLSGKGLGGVFGMLKDIGSGIAGIFGGAGGIATGIGAGSAQVAVGGAGSAASGAASAAAGVAKAASGALGMVNVASSVLSSVTDVLSFLGQRHIEKDVAGIEVTTRAIFAEIFNLRVDSWDRETHLMKKLDDLWRGITEGSESIYGRLGEIWETIAIKNDDLINAVRSIGSVVAVPIAAVGESIESQLSKARSDLVGTQAARGGLEALHGSFTALDSLYGRFLFEGPGLFTEALRIVGASEADALAVGVSDSLKQNFSHLYGMIASGMGLDDHSLFRQLSLVMTGIQGEMENLGDYEQLGGQVSSLERTIERLEAARKERDKNTIGHLVDRVNHWGAGTVGLLSAIAEKITGVRTPIDTGGGLPAATPTGGGPSGPAATALNQVSARSAAIQAAMRQIVGRVDAVRALATGDYAPTSELVSLWTSTTKAAALEYNHLAMEMASLGTTAFDSLGRSADLYDLVATRTNPTLENIHTAVATRDSPTIIFNNPQFKDRSDIDYAVEQISRNLR